MPSRRSIEHHERAARFRDNSREGVEDSDLFGARRAQVLAKQGLSLCIKITAAILHDFLDVAICLRLGVNSVDAQTGTSPASVIARWAAGSVVLRCTV